MSIDQYSPRAMAQALMVMKPARSFLRQLMIRREETYNVEQVDVDIKIGARRLAPFVNPNISPGKVMDRIGFQTQTYTAPMIAPKRPITVNDLQKRLPGENVFQASSPEQRAAQLLGEDLAELDEDITRREEWMCAQAAFTSSIPVVGDDVNVTIQFPRTASLVAAAPTANPAAGLGSANPTSTQLANTRRWDQQTADIVTQFRQMRRLFVKQTGLNPDYAVLGALAADVLVNAPSLSGLTGILNTMRLDLGQIKPELRDGGATYYGQFAGTGIDIWSYDEWYIDPVDGVEKPMVPDKMMLLGSSRSYTVMRYGAVGVATGNEADAKISLVSARRVPESWVVKEPAVRWLKLSARPLVVPVQNDAYLTCQVIS